MDRLKHEPMRHLHICGAPRSGTTLLMELLRTCYDWDWAPDVETSVPDSPRDRHGRCLTKNPGYGNQVRSILRDPRIWIVHCQRDPRDIVCSRHNLAPELYWANLGQWRNDRTVVNRARSHPRLVVSRYEKLVREPDLVQRELEDHIPWLERKLPFSQFQNRAQPSGQSLDAMRGLRPVTPESIGRWQRHLPRLAGQLLLHGSISRELMEDGYEENTDWLQQLANVQPDRTPGYWPDRLTLGQSIKRRKKILQQLMQLMIRHRDHRRG